MDEAAYIVLREYFNVCLALNPSIVQSRIVTYQGKLS